jgi:hypothetical protein
MNCELMLTYNTPAYMFNVYKNQLSRQTGSRNLKGSKTLPTIWHTYMKLVNKYQISAIACQTMNLIWKGDVCTMKPVEDESWINQNSVKPNLKSQCCKSLFIILPLHRTYNTPAYMFNVYKNQQGRQTGSRNLKGSKTLPTLWHTYMKLVTKFIFINHHQG